MPYGLPYKGSKNMIAKAIVQQLPPADTFVDLFCGGGAIVHAAKESGKYKHFIINDCCPGLMTFLYQAFTTGVEERDEWCSRQKFFEGLRTDWYNTLCYSFANDCRTYAFGKDREEYKEALFNIIRNADTTQWTKLGFTYPNNLLSLPTAKDRRLAMRQYIHSTKPNCTDADLSVDALVRGERIASLKNTFNTEELTMYEFQYSDVPIPQNSLIYCDIPYIGTNGYDGTSKVKPTLDYEAFYNWATQQKNIFISEFAMPTDRFTQIWHSERACNLKGAGTSKSVTEKLFIPINNADVIPSPTPQIDSHITTTVQGTINTATDTPRITECSINYDAQYILTRDKYRVTISCQKFDSREQIEKIIEAISCNFPKSTV